MAHPQLMDRGLIEPDFVPALKCRPIQGMDSVCLLCWSDLYLLSEHGHVHACVSGVCLRDCRLYPNTFDTGEELFLGNCESRGVGGDDVLVNTNLVVIIGFFGQVSTRTGHLRHRRSGSIRL